MIDEASGSIKRRREKLGWTQAELARRAGVTVQTVSNVEVGRTGAEDTRRKLEAALASGEQSCPTSRS